MHFGDVTNYVMHHRFNSLDVTKRERISEDQLALVVIDGKKYFKFSFVQITGAF